MNKFPQVAATIIIPLALMIVTPSFRPARVAASSLSQAPNTLSVVEKRQGWALLFDGQSMKGWHTYARPKETQWEAKDGALHMNPARKGKGDLLTDREYGNFDLKLEWKISPKGNSGIIFYVKDDPAKYPESYMTGLEMQVLDNEGHPDGKIHKHRAGDLYDLIACSRETVKPVGEWNQVEIRCVNGDLKLFLNNVNVVSTTLWDDHWKQMVAGSKFKEWPDFGTFRKGHVDLQDHGNEVWFRNIKIKKL
ncbi:MAG: DUF1080 domain-containing protein [Bacteroidota bacterium]|nr:DUF1080 domain-containing protein [Bacteroidota bacterium]